MSEQSIGDGKLNREALKAALSRGIKNLEKTPVASGPTMPPIETLTEAAQKPVDSAVSSDASKEWFDK